ncbi:MAG: pilin [Candidatus Paceibacterota bacterium]
MTEILLQTAQTLPFLEADNLPGFVSSIYSFALTIVGIAVFVQILRAGFKWLTAAGNAGKAGEGKTMMTNAVIGAILLFASYLILFIINPDLVDNTFNFNVPSKESSSVSRPVARATTTEATSGTATVAGVITEGTAFHKGVPVANAQAGAYFFSVKVTDADGKTDQRNYRIDVVPRGSTPPPFDPVNINFDDVEAGSPQIITSTLPNGAVGQPYWAEITAVGGRTPYVYSIIQGDGSVPDGIGIQATWETPILTLENLTAERTPAYSFRQDDRYRITLSGARPDTAIDFFSQKNGVVSPLPGVAESRTDENGDWINEGALADLGSWHIWTVVDGRISNIIGFQVIAQAVVSQTSSDVHAVNPTSTRGSSNFTPCTPNNFCEIPETGERFKPGPSGCQGTGYSGPPGTRQVVECFYPEQDPNDICRSFDLAWRNCSSNLGKIRVIENGKRTNNFDVSQLPEDAQGEAPAGTLYTIDPTIPGSPSRTIGCSYGTLQQQALAVRCGMPASSVGVGYCLPGYAGNPKYCVSGEFNVPDDQICPSCNQ